MTAERKLVCADRVRRTHQAERRLRRLEAKVQAGHTNLTPFRDYVAARLEAIGRES